MPRRAQLIALGVSAAGTAAFHLAGLPLPFLLGPMFGCLAAGLAGAPLAGTPAISGAMRTVLGVAVGASITPALIGRIETMALSIALVPLFVAVVGAVGYPYFRRICGFDRPTAYFAAMPGGLQDMLVLGVEAGGDPRALSLVHATRVLAIVSIMPALLTWGWGLGFAGLPGQPIAAAPPAQLALMAACAAAGWWGAARIGLFGWSFGGATAIWSAVSIRSRQASSGSPRRAVTASRPRRRWAKVVRRWSVANRCRCASRLSAFRPNNSALAASRPVSGAVTTRVIAAASAVDDRSAGRWRTISSN